MILANEHSGPDPVMLEKAKGLCEDLVKHVRSLYEQTIANGGSERGGPPGPAQRYGGGGGNTYGNTYSPNSPYGTPGSASPGVADPHAAAAPGLGGYGYGSWNSAGNGAAGYPPGMAPPGGM